MTKEEVYLSFTIYEAPCVGCFSQKVVADVNNRQILIEKDGSYELVVSPRPKPQGETRNWLSLDSMSPHAAPQLITRHYYEEAIPAQLNSNIVHPHLTISPIKTKQLLASARLTDLGSAQRLERVQAFVKSHSLEMQQDPAKAPSWFSFSPNNFGPAVLFRNEVQGVGAVDIVYSAGPFRLDDPDEDGLVITATMPRAAFVNIVLWNRLLQTFGYEQGRQISLNRKQMKKSNLSQSDLTGMVKILLSKRHPKNGLPRDMEWLDTEGREDGTMFWRFLLPEGEVETPTAKLVKIDDIN
jgi:hypothetical protein